MDLVEQREVEEPVCFGSFRLYKHARYLEKEGTMLDIGSRALDLLIVLAERLGEVVRKDELFKRVWPDTLVEEGALRVQIAMLRKILGVSETGESYITNISGRGYCLVAPVDQVPAPAAARARESLPPLLQGIFGRSECLTGLLEKLREQRFLTIMGPGGIGKTTVAVMVAHALYQPFDGAVYFVDLAPMNDPSLLPIAVANAIGLAVQSSDPAPIILNFLRQKRALIVFDSCEHLVESTAALAEQIFNQAPDVHILATSRETLQIEGEQVYWLQPLESPPDDAAPDAETAMAFSAVQLFMQRATATSDRFRLSDADAPVVASICRKLDGIPLAIEIVARRVHALELNAIERALDDRMKLSWRGRRTAFRRHQTLEATLDWSYNLLSEPERLIFSRLAVFAGSFSLDAASAVAITDADHAWQFLDAVDSLLSKSMMIALPSGLQVRYRQLTVTRAYARQKLAESGALQTIERRHAMFFNQWLVDAQAAAKSSAEFSWRAIFDAEIHNIRAALDWSATEQGDAEIMIDLTVNALPMLIGTQMFLECQIRCEQLLDLHGDRFVRPTVQEMRLLTALALAASQTQGFEEKYRALSDRGLQLSRALKDEACEVMAGFVLYVYDVFGRSATAALATANDFLTLAKARDCTPDIASAHRMIAGARLYRGELAEARHHLDISERYYGISGMARGGVSYFDGALQTRSRQAEVAWMLGNLDQASEGCEATLRETLQCSDDSTCFAVLMYPSIPMAIYLEHDLTQAKRRIALLTSCYARLMSGWGKAAVEAWEAAAEIVCGNDPGALQRLAAANEGLRRANATVFLMQFLGTLAEGLGRAGRLTEAHAALDEAMAASLRGNFVWWRPELLRIQGNVLLAARTEAATLSAEQCFREAIELAGYRAPYGSSCARRSRWRVLISRAAATARRSRFCPRFMTSLPKDSGFSTCGRPAHSWPNCAPRRHRQAGSVHAPARRIHAIDRNYPGSKASCGLRRIAENLPGRGGDCSAGGKEQVRAVEGGNILQVAGGHLAPAQQLLREPLRARRIGILRGKSGAAGLGVEPGCNQRLRQMQILRCAQHFGQPGPGGGASQRAPASRNAPSIAATPAGVARHQIRAQRQAFFRMIAPDRI